MDNSKKITATVCIYSGRLNPRWEISKAEYNNLLLLISKLPATMPQPQASLLGYTGVIVVNQEARLYVFDGVATIQDGKSDNGYIDGDRAIEKKILQTMPEVLYKEISPLLP